MRDLCAQIEEVATAMPSETIQSITEVHDRQAGEYKWSRQDGYEVVTSEQTIWLGIDNYQSCCESWGYLTSEDDPSKFIGAELRQLVRTDQNRTTKVIRMSDYDYKQPYNEDEITLDAGDAVFIDLETDRGVFQFVAYNSHNSYYGHTVTITSRQLTLSETV